MGILDNVADRARETISEWTGYTVAPVQEVEQLREAYGEMGFFLDEVEDMAMTVMDYVGGRPHEVQATHRRRLAQQSRIALIHDPLAGAEAQLRSNFAFGRGIGTPQAKDPDVQKIIDAAWKDPNNERKLTSFEAQRHRSTEMLATANLFPTLFAKNGKTRVGFRDADDVTDVVTDPEDDETPLWYVVRKRRTEWDFDLHQPRPTLTWEAQNGVEKVWYVEHWRNVEDLREWAEQSGEKMPEGPPKANVLDGQIEHFRINRIGRSQFGVPPMARTLRFYTAINQLTESQVQMRQGAASIIAQRIKRGGPSDIMKSVSSVVNRAGEIGAATFRRRQQGGPPDTTGPGTHPGPREAMPPPPTASWYQGFEHDKLEAVNLRSGAGEALQDAQIVRAPIAAASGFGQHYLGDPSNTNLATATTLELPTLMEVSAWQETFEGIYTWFTDRAIENAVQAGLLGGMIAEDADYAYTKPLPHLRIQEDREEMEARTGRDLSYSFQMPYPGRRNLPDVISAVSSTLLTLDPAGRNWPLREKMVDFLFRHGFQTEDPSADVEAILAEAQKLAAEAEQKEEEERALQVAQMGGGEGGALPSANGTGNEGGEDEASSGSSQYGEKKKRTPPSREMGGGPRTREVLLREGFDSAAFLDALQADAAAGFDLSDPAFLTANGANGSAPPAAADK